MDNRQKTIKKKISFNSNIQRNNGNKSLFIFLIFLVVFIGAVILFYYFKPSNNLGINGYVMGIFKGVNRNKTIQNENNQSLNGQSSVSHATPSPNSILHLNNWKLTLPTNSDHSGSPDEIKWPELESFSIKPYFQLNSQKTGVIFQVPVSGVTTANSKFPRSELREMSSDGTEEASWSSDTGSHRMFIQESITHLPVLKPEIVAGQIHDATSDVAMVRLENQNLFIQGDGQNLGTLDPAYVLGTQFTVEFVVGDGHIKVYYNGVQKIDYKKSGSGYYFKAGCYDQSNATKGESADAYGEVIIYQLEVHHS